MLSILKSKLSCKTFDLLTWNITPKRLQWEKCTRSQLQSACEACGNCGRDVKHSQRYRSNAEKCVSQDLNSDVKFCVILIAISMQKCLQCRMQLIEGWCQVNQIAIVTTGLRNFTLVKFHPSTDFRPTIVDFNIKHCRLKHGTWKRDKILRNNTCTWKLKKLSEINAPKY